MKVEGLYIGGWFQRTTLQLSEVYDFLRAGTSVLKLSKSKLAKLRENLELTEVKYGIDNLEYIKFSTATNVDVKIFEDGLIVLGSPDTSKDTLFSDIEHITDYYENKLSPAINYLFSLGAPVPKELANIRTVYPYFIVLKNATKTQLEEFIQVTEKEQYFEYSNEQYEVVRGDMYYFINNKTKTKGDVERYIEEQIFLREFKAQLHHYLNLHRTIWEKIADVKEKSGITGKEIITFSNKVEGYAKTVNLVGARINQMSTYLRTREKIAKNDQDLQKFLDMIGYRYENLGNTLAYIQQLWAMTKNYVDSALSLFKNLRTDITNKSVSNLTAVTSMGVGASIIGLFTETSAPTISIFGIIYFFALALFGYGVNKVMLTASENKKYKINDIDYDKNIK